jgi:beta-glucosidase
MKSFPEGFLWGAATSHFQVEGNPAEIAPRSSDWAVWTAGDGRIADSSTADQACEFFTRYPDDIDLLAKLNLNAFRISLNWPTLCPQASKPGEPFAVDKAQVEHYRKLLTAIKAKGIKTFVTLFHFCLPRRLADQGGWLNPETAQEFGRFAQFLAREYKGLVDYWMTINEPLAYVYQGYVAGVWPPGLKHSYPEAFQCVRNMLVGHAAAYHAIHSEDASASVSYTMHWRPFIARNKFNPADLMVQHMRNAIFNHLFPRAVQTGTLSFPFPCNFFSHVKDLVGPIPGLKDSIDFLAINYYTRDLCKFDMGNGFDLFGVTVAPEIEPNAMGWETYPQGLYDLLVSEIPPYHFDSKGRERPIIITENGYASAFPADLAEGDWSLEDEQRVQYLHLHLLAIHRAICAGVNVKGYLHWALLDNFEWAEGLRIRFGLVRVAFPTQERTLRKSALVYADIARCNAIDSVNALLST